MACCSCSRSRATISCLRVEHPAAAQMIQRPALGGRHQPGAGLFRHAGRGPMLERGQQGFLRQVLGQRHVAQHPRQAGDQPRLLDPPDGEDRAMGGSRRRPSWPPAGCRACIALRWRPVRPAADPAGERANLAGAFPARHEVLVELHELDRRRHGLLLVAEARRSRSRRSTSLASTNGPSTTLSLPSVMRTCAPVASGISPPLSSMRPALISRSASLCIASISSGVGGVGWADVTMNMKRI